MSKYRNAKYFSDGIMFDSKKEAKRYHELKVLEQEGMISDLQIQVKFTLIPAQYEMVWHPRKKDYVRGKCLERECSYKADFVYRLNGVKDLVVEDTKGFRTKDYIIKRKLMLSVHGIRVKEV